MVTNLTKYQKLQTALKAELSSGRFRVGDRFYTEREIMDKYQVSGITVARALSEMTEQGYFERKRKLGTFVKESPEMPGMSGCLMTRPLYINRSCGEDLGGPQSGNRFDSYHFITKTISEVNNYLSKYQMILF